MSKPKLLIVDDDEGIRTQLKYALRDEYALAFAEDRTHALAVLEEIEPELRELFKVPQPIRLLWVVPIGRARFWPGAKPRRKVADFTHYETYDANKLRDESWIKAWPKG